MESEKKREEIFAKARERFGFVPNVIKELSVAPVVAEAYLKGIEVLEAHRQRRAVNTARRRIRRWERQRALTLASWS